LCCPGSELEKYTFFGRFATDPVLNNHYVPTDVSIDQQGKEAIGGGVHTASFPAGGLADGWRMTGLI
jgi:hypothetical protein